MKLATKTEEVFAILQKIKQRGGPLVTNFFLDDEKLNCWINNNLFHIQEEEQSVLFFRKDRSFYHLYYYATSLTSLQFLIKNSLPQKPLVLDIVGKVSNIDSQVNLFKGSGFKVYTWLQRYTRINNETTNYHSLSNDVSLALDKDAETIVRLFETNFDEISEQVPNLNEVKNLIKNKKILVLKSDDYIKGFLVRTFSGQSTILNNFLVDKHFRGEKIGSKLLKHYIFESREIKRMTLWVVFNNENALNVYQRFGYVKDDLVDIILVNKNE